MRKGDEDGTPAPSCAEARKALLQAPLEDLTEEGPAPLARHLATCPACRARARWIREDEVAFRNALARTEPRMAPGEAEALAMRGRAGSREVVKPGVWKDAVPMRRFRRRLPGWKVAVPAAAAAAAALFLGQAVLRTPPPDGGPRPLTTYQDQEPVTRVHVEVSPDVRTVLLTTPDPRFTVVWLH
jgi:anti-sigma factor RsiW